MYCVGGFAQIWMGSGAARTPSLDRLMCTANLPSVCTSSTLILGVQILIDAAGPVEWFWLQVRKSQFTQADMKRWELSFPITERSRGWADSRCGLLPRVVLSSSVWLDLLRISCFGLSLIHCYLLWSAHTWCCGSFALLCLAALTEFAVLFGDASSFFSAIEGIEVSFREESLWPTLWEVWGWGDPSE